MNLQGHGGGCCGSKHLSGFGSTDSAYQTILQYEGTVDLLNRDQRVEVILNQTQVRNMPQTLRFLASIGFVMVEVYRNSNSTQLNYVFTRARNRTETALRDHARDIGWQGQIMTGSLQGILPSTLPHFANVENIQNNNEFRVGDIVRLTWNGSRYHGRTLQILQRNGSYYQTALAETFEHGNQTYEVGRRLNNEYPYTRLTLVRRANGNNQRPRTFENLFNEWLQNQTPPMVHTVDENEQVFVQQQQAVPLPPPPAPPREEVVAGSTFHNVYRDGREGAGYPTLEAARQARRGAGRVIRRDYVVTAEGTAVTRNTVVVA